MSDPSELPTLPSPAHTAPRRRRGPHWAVWVLIAVLALVGWQWLHAHRRISDLQEETARRIAAAVAQAQEARTLAKQAQDSFAALQAKLGAVEGKVSDSQSQQVALEAMYQELTRNRDERVLAEIDQAITLAAQQLQLAGNVEAALIALQAADTRLAAVPGGQFIALRRALTRDIERLRALPAVDVPGIALKLDGLVASADTLPLAFEEKPRPAAAGNERPGNVLVAIAADLWAELRALIHVERLDRPDPGLIGPAQVYFLRENFKLRLLNARIALLQRHGRLFREDIAQARQWLERYFDRSQPSVKMALATLEPLAAAQLDIALPTLDESLGAVRNFKLAQERVPPVQPPAPRPAPPAAQPPAAARREG